MSLFHWWRNICFLAQKMGHFHASFPGEQRTSIHPLRGDSCPLLQRKAVLYVQIMNNFKGSQSLPLVLNLAYSLALRGYVSLFLHLLSIDVTPIAVLSVMKNLPHRKARSRRRGVQVRQYQIKTDGYCSRMERTS